MLAKTINRFTVPELKELPEDIRMWRLACNPLLLLYV
jgi:hypothetical protein